MALYNAENKRDNINKFLIFLAIIAQEAAGYARADCSIDFTDEVGTDSKASGLDYCMDDLSGQLSTCHQRLTGLSKPQLHIEQWQLMPMRNRLCHLSLSALIITL